MKWTTSHIIDLEYFLNCDRQLSDELYLKKRDRDIYINDILPKGVTSPKEMLFLWLESMKSQQIRDKKPDNINSIKNYNLSIGDIYEKTLSILKIILFIIGIITGVSICIAFFSYTGRQPLNVAYFFLITLFFQFCLLSLFVLSFIVPKLNPYIEILKLVYIWLFKLLSKLSRIKRDLFISTFIASNIRIIKRGEEIYGYIFLLPIFILMQIFGIAFNIGIVISTLFRVIFFDTAFGWQSTLQISPQLVAEIVKAAAAPWSWFFSSGYPNFDQIVGSRIILKDGIYNLANSDLISWWSFICLAVIFYGLLPRVLMLAGGLIALKASLKKQKFDHADCLNLINRMVLPDDKALKESVDSEKISIIRPPAEAEQIEYFVFIALIPNDIYEFFDIDAFKQIVEKNHSYNISKILVTGINFDKEIESIKNVNYKNYGVLIVQEAWLPPIKENLNFIKSIRKVVDKKSPIVVMLIGKMRLADLTDVEQSDYEIWKIKLSTITDPWLNIAKLKV